MHCIDSVSIRIGRFIVGTVTWALGWSELSHFLHIAIASDVEPSSDRSIALSLNNPTRAKYMSSR